jgi:endo-1,4-beta-xylanase
MSPRRALALAAALAACSGGGSSHLPPPSGTPLRDLTAGRILVGTAVAVDPLRHDPAYQALLAAQYDVLVPENAMKFDQVETSRDHWYWSDADYIVKFAEDHGMVVRGHCLVWHQQSQWAKSSNPAELPAILQNHITTEVGRYEGRVRYWDVVNEAIDDGAAYAAGQTVSQVLRQTFWLQAWQQVYPAKPAYQYIEDAFTWANAADPDALLFYNEYGDEGLHSWGDPNNHKADYTYALVQQLLADGVPIHGVGLQMHVDASGYPLNAGFADQVKRLRDLGLEVHVTELDQRLKVPASQAALDQQGQFYEDLLGASLDAGVGAFLTWGLDDGHSWIPSFYSGQGAGLPFDAGYGAKPAYYGMQRALEATR